jgi:hypothetical protein
MKLVKTVTAVTLLVMPLSLLGCSSTSESNVIPEPTDATLPAADDKAAGKYSAASDGKDIIAIIATSSDQAPAVSRETANTEGAAGTAMVGVPSESVPEKMWTFEEKVTVRSAPSFEAKDVGTLGYGEPVTGVEQDKGWVKIGEGQYVARPSLTDRKARFFRHHKRKRHAHAH